MENVIVLFFTGTAFGDGVRFCVNVDYAIYDRISPPDENGHKRVFLCRVLTGEYCLRSYHLRVPLMKTDSAGRYLLYDTVTDNVNCPAVFIIFHDSQALPVYLVTFKRK